MVIISTKHNLLLFLLFCPPLRGACLNYEVLTLQPHTETSLYLGFVANYYVAMILSPTPPFPSNTRCLLGRATHYSPFSLSPSLTVFFPHRIICPPGRPLYLSYHTKILRSLIQIHLPPPLPCPCHACRIPISTPLPPPRYLLTYPSAVSEPPFSATTDHGAPPSPVALLPITDLIYWYQLHPPLHCFLLIIDVCTQFPSPQFFEDTHH